jgi:5-oxoprolinase (ATP-hydrolysing)
MGIGLADVMRHRSCGIERPLDDESLNAVRRHLDSLEQEAIGEILSEGVPREHTTTTRSLDIRYLGIDAYLTIDWPEDKEFAAAFEAEHRRRYGYIHDDRPLEIAAARVQVVGHVGAALPRSERHAAKQPEPSDKGFAFFEGQRTEVPRFERAELVPGDRIVGPAIVTEDISTSVIDRSWTAEVLGGGELLIIDARPSERSSTPIEESRRRKKTTELSTPDPVLLEVFNNLLASIAEQMGVTLRNTASSVNVKERLDFSCAIFTADGSLVVNAPHVPVHLGAMEETVRQVIAATPDLRPGDVIATNDPYAGGSHLPDVTVITPVHDETSGELRFFVASRAHHAEIGGIAPGSMPPLSKNLAEEGVLIRNLRIVDAGRSRFDVLREILLTAPHPTRDVSANLADVEAQVAANRQGVNDLWALVARFSWPVVRAYMEHVQDAAEHKLRLALARLPIGAHSFTDFVELADGTSVPIAVRFTIHGPNERPAATIDFTGTGPVVDGNLNANRAIVKAAVIYTLRLLIDEDIPLNHGVLRPIEIMLPTCLLNPRPGPSPESTPAVAGGNVETSQRIVDVLLGALGLAGASQGTMNNTVFGDASFGYYETVCGGSGATADGPGASAVQVHMTNTRLTDPEILERRYPARVREFSIRRDSGGAGRNRGGDGTVRQLEFLRPLEVSLLTQRRGPHPPYGAAGGEPGAIGRNRLIRAAGSVVELAGIAQFRVEAGDVLVVETPGGGGFGKIVYDGGHNDTSRNHVR